MCHKFSDMTLGRRLTCDSYIGDRSVFLSLITSTLTSPVDLGTDAIIQTTLKEQLASDVSVLVVAHRLHSVMDADRIVSDHHSIFDLFAFSHEGTVGARFW